jgi:integrase
MVNRVISVGVITPHAAIGPAEEFEVMARQAHNPRRAGPGSSERCEQTVLRRELYPAMKRAGIDRVGPTGEKRTFHSFRHTYAKLALENGRRITWLSRHLGHSSLKVTTDSTATSSGRSGRRRRSEWPGCSVSSCPAEQ